jgi:hypothetical protein
MPTKKLKPSRTLVKRWVNQWHLDRVFWRLKSRRGYILSRLTAYGHMRPNTRETTDCRSDAFECPTRGDALAYRGMIDTPLKPKDFKLVRVTVWLRKAAR